MVSCINHQPFLVPPSTIYHNGPSRYEERYVIQLGTDRKQKGKAEYCSGKEITPRRRAAIITMRVLGLPYHAIRTRTGVAISTANDIYLRAVKTATTLAAERQKQTSLEVQIPGSGGFESVGFEALRRLPAVGGDECELRALDPGGLEVGILGPLDGGNCDPGLSEVEDLGVWVPRLLEQLENSPEACGTVGLEVRIPGVLGEGDKELGFSEGGGGR